MCINFPKSRSWITYAIFSFCIAVKTPNFQCLLDITRILQKTDVTFNFAAVTVIHNVHNFKTEIQRCIDDLVTIKNYNTALELSCIAGLHASEIILAQVIILKIFGKCIVERLYCFYKYDIIFSPGIILKNP